METTCGSCWGTGRITFSSCGGKGYHGRLTGNMEFEMSTCLICGGSKKITCSFCRGRGKIGSLDPPKYPSGEYRKKSSDPIEGVWTADGGNYEFIKEKEQYRVIETGAIGKSGEGTTTLEGNTVTLNMKNILLGSYTVRLQLVGNGLEGVLKILGFPVPFILYRQ